MVRVRTRNPDMASTVGFIGTNMNLKAVTIKSRATVIADRSRQEVVLNIRVSETGTGSDKPAGLKVVGRPQAGFGEHQLCANPEFREPSQIAINGNGLFASILEIHLQVILQIFAHARQFVAHRHPRRQQHRQWAHARPL